jgi:hypothetical protein
MSRTSSGRSTRTSRHFYNGTDLRKTKYPLVWCDIVHLAEVLSCFEWLRDDTRLRDMIAVLAGQGDAAGRFAPGSAWMAWKTWDFGQKKVPSRTLTWAVQRIPSRFGEVDGEMTIPCKS